MTTRKHLTPPHGVPAPDGVHPVRRGGARRDIGDRITLKGEDGQIAEGWALNVSRGGLRLIVEEKVDQVKLGTTFEVTIGADDDALHRRGRIVWIQEEPDGLVVGLEFVGLSQSLRSVPPAPEGASVLPDDEK